MRLLALNAEDVDRAYRAASDAFESWSQTTPSERQAALLKIADIVEANAEELIALESENTGKAIAVTASEEIPPMVDQIRFFAGAANGSRVGAPIGRDQDGADRHPGDALLGCLRSANVIHRTDSTPLRHGMARMALVSRVNAALWLYSIRAGSAGGE